MPQPSTTVRFFQCASAVIWCLLSAGIVFGFAALKPILISEGVYHELCDAKTSGGLDVCIEQDLKLNKMFTISAVTTNATALVVGYILDNYGPRVCGFIGSFFLFFASFTLADYLDFFVNALALDKYLLGYITLAIGGPFVFISCFQLANTFPKYSGMILALLTGAFDTSSAVFLVYRLAYQKLSQISLPLFFKWYVTVPLFIAVCQAFLMPSESYKTLGNIEKLAIEGLDENGQLPEGDDGSQIIEDANERSSLLSSNERRLSAISSNPTDARLTSIDSELGLTTKKSRAKSVYEEYVESKMLSKSGHLFGILDGKSIKTQLSSPFFLLMCVFCTIQMIRINYFVATIRSQEQYLVGDALAADLNGIFDIALPLGGVVAIPFIGILLDNFQTQTVMFILYLISIFIGLCGIVPHYFFNLVGILILVAYRPLYYTAISDYSAKVFGFETFGTVYGLMMFTAGVINYFAVYLDKFTKSTFKGNPGPINWALIMSTVIAGAALLLYIEFTRKNAGKLKLQEEAEEAEVVQIPQ
ncbi:hypothetical protein WICPIJ_002192 [Wickerhamomyces pijperi]|uniref:Protein FMP42 n=1 Tax=Wickerhamomyces pijperi TaxID=599730 RepID=A0A9P8TQ15_WICPI|nr:hypothetical protein WICPIJ_002192 [Wickerhamomyces pijperi]